MSKPRITTSCAAGSKGISLGAQNEDTSIANQNCKLLTVCSFGFIDRVISTLGA
jgi:hypothetical protein